MKGVVVAWDGLDGSGKTTAIQMLRRKLEADGLRVWSGKVRPLVGSIKLSSAEAIQNYCGRLHVVLESLAEVYDVVLLDRSVVTFLTFWAFWRRIVTPEAGWRCVQDCIPTWSVLLEIPLEVCRERIRQRGEDPYQRDWDGGDYYLTLWQKLRLSSEFLKSQLDSRLMVFENNEAAVEWVYQRVCPR